MAAHFRALERADMKEVGSMSEDIAMKFIPGWPVLRIPRADTPSELYQRALMRLIFNSPREMVIWSPESRFVRLWKIDLEARRLE